MSNTSIHHRQFVGGGCNYVIGLGGVKEEAEAADAVKLPSRRRLLSRAKFDIPEPCTRTWRD